MKFVLFAASILLVLIGFITGRSLHVAPQVEATSDVELVAHDQDIRQNSIPDEQSIESLLNEIIQKSNTWQRHYEITDLAAQWDSPALSIAATYLTERLNESGNDRLLSIILTRWSSVDPTPSLDFAVQLYDRSEPKANALFLEQAVNWARTEPDAVWKHASELTGAKELATRFRYAVLSTLAETDPQQAISYYQTLEGAERIEGVLTTIVTNLAKIDLDQAESLLLIMPKKDHAAIVSGIIGFYAVSDPFAGLEYVLTLPVGTVQPYIAARSLLHPWIRRNPSEAASAVLNMPAGTYRERFLSTAINIWSKNDMDGAIEWLLPRIENAEVVNAWRNLTYTLVRTAPERGLELMQKHPELAESKSHYLSVWMQTDVDAALNWASNNLKGSDLSEALNRSVYSLSHSNPVAAVQIIDIMPSGSDRDHAMVNVASQLAGQDVDLALEWVLGQSEDAAQHLALNAVMQTWTKQSPTEAAEYLQHTLQSENELLKQQLVRQVAGSWAEQDPSAALQWLDGLNDPKLSEAAMGNLLFEWSKNDLRAATEYVSNLPSDTERSEHYSKLVLNAVRADPIEAIKWVKALPEADQSDAVFSNLYSHWMQRDSEAASEWINDMPKGHERDLAANQIVSEINNKSPKDALPWALEIEDTGMRDRALRNVVSGARRLDLQVVREAIAAISDEKMKQRYTREYLQD